MATVHLKSGEIVEIPFDKLEDYLYDNEDKIQLQKYKRRKRDEPKSNDSLA